MSPPRLVGNDEPPIPIVGIEGAVGRSSGVNPVGQTKLLDEVVSLGPKAAAKISSVNDGYTPHYPQTLASG